MKDYNVSNTFIEIKNEDGETEMQIAEYEVTHETYKGRRPETIKYADIFVPHGFGKDDGATVSKMIADYRTRGYNVNVMYSGSEPVKECISNLLRNNRDAKGGEEA